MSSLRLRYKPENEGHGELFAHVQVEGFSANGAAWFNRADIEAFFQRLSVHPLPQSERVQIVGGIGARPNGEPESPRLRLTVEPAGYRGHLRVGVLLVEEALRPSPHDLLQTADLAFITTYAELDRFRLALPGLLSGDAEAVLGGDA